MSVFQDNLGEKDIFGQISATTNMYTGDDVDHIIKNFTYSLEALPTASEQYLNRCVLLVGLQAGYVKGHVYKCVSATETVDEEEVTVYSWEDQNIARFPVGNCSNIICIRVSGSTTASIKWTGPDDTVAENGIILGKLRRVTLVRNADHIPEDIDDGTIVVVATSKDTYASTMFVDTGLAADHDTYYYKLFPETEDGAITNDNVNAFQTDVLTWAAIKLIIDNNQHKDLLPVGTIISLPTHDTYGRIDMEVVAYEDDVDLQDSSIPHCVVLQSRYLLTGGKQFDASEFYSVLTTDTTVQDGKKYYAKFLAATGSVVDGTTYYTLESDYTFAEATGLNVGDVIGTDTPALYTATSGANNNQWTMLTAPVGTTIPSNTWYERNSDQNATNGNNRWDISGVRKYLNATEPGGDWWEASTVFDKAPSYATTLGFLGGFHDSDFLGMIKPVINTNVKATIHGGGTYQTIDKVWLASVKQLGDASNNSGLEGKTVFPKYRDLPTVNGVRPKLQKMYTTSTSAQYWWTRSAYTGYSNYVWCVSPSGSFIYYGNASTANGSAPCLAIA